MRVKRAAAVAVTFAALAYGAYEYRARVSTLRLQTRVAESSEPVSAPQIPADERPSSPGTLKVSGSVLDFGEVPLGYPVKQTLVVMNTGVVEVEVSGAGLSSPFGSNPGSVALASRSAAEFEVTFDPVNAGTYEQRLRLRLAMPDAGPLDVLVRGRAIPSPMSAGILIPPPPDAVLRAYQEKALQGRVAQARQQLAAFDQAQQEGSGSGQSPAQEGVEADEENPPQAPSEDQPVENRVQRSAAEAGRARLAAEILAFGFALGAAEDLNKIPAPIPQGDTKPDLPPPPGTNQGQGGTGGGQTESNEGTSDETDTGDGTDEGTGDDSGGQTEEGELKDGDDTSNDAQPPDDKQTNLPTFTVAPNSSVLVYSSKGPLSLQTLPVRAASDGSVFEIDGRIRFPDLSLAFGETIGLKQWGNAQGVVAADGNFELGLTLRLDDPNGEVVLDLPVKMTTKMTVGYSAEGRLMFANGIPRDPTTGDFKLVGIANIPLGTGGSLDKAPVVLELLGRLTM